MNYTKLLGIALLALSSPAFASTLFSENFEGGALSPSSWGVIGGGEIVADPFNSANHVLAFSDLHLGGDTFTVGIPMNVSEVTLSFDYLGLDGAGTGAGTDTGGFIIGIPAGAPIGTVLVGTKATGDPVFPDMEGLTPGVWEHISITFNPATFGYGAGTVLAFEEWAFSANSPGNAFFDNIELTSVTPEPSSAIMMLGGISLLFLATFARARRTDRALSAARRPRT